MRSMTLNRLAATVLLAAPLVGCADLTQVNPNRQTTDTFWLTADHAVRGTNAIYQAITLTGAYGRWLHFAYNSRSDLGFSKSPAVRLSNYSKFTFDTYDYQANAVAWDDLYHAIYRANQVIGNVPEIPMDPGLRGRLVGEAKFLRALMYFNLVNLWGNVPLVLEVTGPNDRPEQVPPAQTWAQIEKDLQDARASLPVTYPPADQGRATKDAATSLLALSYMQQKRWAEAAPLWQEVITSPANYGLLPSYAALFDGEDEHHRENIFAIQFTDNERSSTGAQGMELARMMGPRGVGFADGQPTDWFFQQFFLEPTVAGQTDPRLDLTIFWNKPAGMDVYGRTFRQRYGANSKELFWKKHMEYWLTNQLWESPVDFQIFRLGGVLLFYAETLNEMGRTADAYPHVDRVRQRVNLAPLSQAKPGLSQAQMRAQIEHEQILELGYEAHRWLYLARHDLLGPQLAAHDDEFRFFEPGKSELLPIPQSEVDMNPNVQQNPGW